MPRTSTDDTTDATDGPLPDPADEREAIRDALPRDVHILQWHGGEPGVALVKRDKTPPTEHATRGETVVLVEWHGHEDYAISVAVGRPVRWEITDELMSFHDSRSDAIDAAAACLAEE